MALSKMRSAQWAIFVFYCFTAVVSVVSSIAIGVSHVCVVPRVGFVFYYTGAKRVRAKIGGNIGEDRPV